MSSIRSRSTFFCADLRVVVGDRVGELAEIAGQHLLLACAEPGRDVGSPGDRRRREVARSRGRDGDAAARGLGAKKS